MFPRGKKRCAHSGFTATKKGVSTVLKRLQKKNGSTVKKEVFP